MVLNRKKQMENVHLLKKCDSIKRDLEYLVDELIAEIENLEEENSELKNRVQYLEVTIEEIQNEE
nr:hypothetical protein [Bifidobacterium animalis]